MTWAGATDPPAGAVNCTGTPFTPRLSAATTRATMGCASCAPVWPLWPQPLTMVIPVGAGAKVIGVEAVMPVGVFAVTVSVARVAGATRVPVASITTATGPLADHDT